MANPTIPPEVIKAAQEAQRETGAPACVMLGQAILESGWFKELAAPSNCLGLKWAKGCPYPAHITETEDAVDGKMQEIKAPFVAFPSWDACFLYYAHEIMNPSGYYRNARFVKNNWRAYLHAIAKIYAPDNPRYEEEVNEIIVTSHLDYYNDLNAS